MVVRETRRLPSLVGSVAATLLLMAFPAFASAPATATSPAVALYVGNYFIYEPIDPLTLEDEADVFRPDLELDPLESDGVLHLSADGSTMVLMGSAGEVVVHDGINSFERSRFSTNGAGGLVALSDDGSRLVVAVGVDLSDRSLEPPAWKVFDTRTGELVAAVQGSVSGQTIIAPDATRLYQLVGTGGAEDLMQRTGPESARLIAYDLTTGEEIGRLDLPEVRLGSWWSGEKIGADADNEGYPVSQFLSPAIAVAPDGEYLAIVHAEGDALTMVNTEKLTVSRAVALTTPESVTSRLLGLLPLVPQSAAAKAADGTWLRADFSPDGARLYLTGSRTEIEDERMVGHGLGLRVIDVATGQIIGRALDDVDVNQVHPTPDGGSLYVTDHGIDEETGVHTWTLRRLNGQTLDVLAERTFDSVHRMLMVPEPQAS